MSLLDRRVCARGDRPRVLTGYLVGGAPPGKSGGLRAYRVAVSPTAFSGFGPVMEGWPWRNMA